MNMKAPIERLSGCLDLIQGRTCNAGNRIKKLTKTKKKKPSKSELEDKDKNNGDLNATILFGIILSKLI